MVYNRYGEAFLALLGAMLFLTPEPALKKSWADWVEAGFAGFCLPLLLFCKLNYFAGGVGFFALACLLGRLTARQALLGLLSAVLFFKLALILTGIPFSALWGDYRIMLAAQSVGHRLHDLAVQTVKGVLFLPILVLLAWEISCKPDERRIIWPHFLLIAVIYGGEILLVASNAQQHEMPLLALAALYGAEIIRRQARFLAEDRVFIAARNSVAALLLLFFLLPTLVPDFKTIRYSVRRSMEGHSITPETLRSTRLNDFQLDSGGSRNAEMRYYEAIVDEGMQLLRRHASPRMRLAVFMFSNPYQIALGLPPAKGGIVCWSSYGINQRSHPPLKRMLGDATHILTDESFPEIKDTYGAEWDALHLEVVEKTKNFMLWKVPEQF